MEQKMKLTKDIIDAVVKKIDGSAIVSEDKTLSFPHIYNVSEVADAILALLVEYEKQVNDKTKKLIDEMIKTQDEESVIEFHAIDLLTELKEKL